MSCESYSNGSSPQVEHAMGSLTDGFCPTTLQEIADEFAAKLISVLPTAFSTFTIGSSTPDPEDQDKPWLRLDPVDCEPMGFFLYWSGGWRRATPLAPCPGTVSHVYLNPTPADEEAAITAIELLDMPGGVDDGFGPFWRLCDGLNGTPDLRGRFIVGAGDGTAGNPLDTDITSRAQAVEGGAEGTVLVRDNLPADTFTRAAGVTSIITGGTGTFALIASGGATGTSIAPFKTPSGTAHSNLPPFTAIYPIMRTTRLV